MSKTVQLSIVLSLLLMMMAASLSALTIQKLTYSFGQSAPELQVELLPKVKESGIRHIVSTPKKAPSLDSIEIEEISSYEQTEEKKLAEPIEEEVALEALVPKQVTPSVQHLTQTDYDSPSMIVFEDEILLEFPKAMATTENIRLAVSRVLLSPTPFLETDLLSKAPLSLQKKPRLYGKILDQQQKPLRYPTQARQFADFLLSHHSELIEDDMGSYVHLHIPVQQQLLKGPAKKYETLVKHFSDEFAVDPSLVFAVMETESNFNPKAVSKSGAIGLMQIKANAAGKDVYSKIDQLMGKPNKHILFDSDENIRMGTAYLSLLQHDYFAEVDDELTKKYLTISSYNGGMSNVLKLFGQSRDQSLDKINRLRPRQVFQKLTRSNFLSKETKDYLEKVLKAEKRYETTALDSIQHFI